MAKKKQSKRHKSKAAKAKAAAERAEAESKKAAAHGLPKYFDLPEMTLARLSRWVRLDVGQDEEKVPFAAAEELLEPRVTTALQSDDFDKVRQAAKLVSTFRRLQNQRARRDLEYTKAFIEGHVQLEMVRAQLALASGAAAQGSELTPETLNKMLEGESDAKGHH